MAGISLHKDDSRCRAVTSRLRLSIPASCNPPTPRGDQQHGCKRRKIGGARAVGKVDHARRMETHLYRIRALLHGWQNTATYIRIFIICNHGYLLNMSIREKKLNPLSSISLGMIAAICIWVFIFLVSPATLSIFQLKIFVVSV